jgi:hypothetical protein
MKARRKKYGRILISGVSGVVKSLRELILSEKFMKSAKRRSADFKRNRKMGFTQLIIFMVNLLRTSTQTALDRFFELIALQART